MPEKFLASYYVKNRGVHVFSGFGGDLNSIHIYTIYMWFWAKMGPNFGPKYFHNYEEVENDIPTDWKPMGSTFKICGARPSMCTHRHTIWIFLKIGEISGLGPLKSEDIVPPACTYWGAHHGGFIAQDLSYNIFRSQLLTPISSKVMFNGSFFSKIATNFQISFIYDSR